MAGNTDAVSRYLANNKPKPAPAPAKKTPVPTAAQASAAGQRRGEALNEAYAALGYQVGPYVHTDSVKVDENGNPVFPAPSSSVPGAAQQDWSSYLGLYGLPADVLKEINSIFSKTPDIKQAVVIAQAYVRGTPWYSQTYPGIQEAMAKGVVRDEADYRSRMNDFAQVYRQYANRDVTAAEYADHLREGVTVDTLGRRFQGAALADTYGNDWQYYEGNFGEGRLTSEEQTAYGRQAAGLDSPLGLKVQRRLQMAQERVQKVFSGQLAQGPLSLLNRPDRPADIGR